MTERLIKWTKNGIEKAKDIEKKDKIQKNFVIDKEVADGIKVLAKEFDVKESRMLEEMYYTFAELLEKGKEDKKAEEKPATTGRGKGRSKSKNTNTTSNKTENDVIEGQVDVDEAIKNADKTETKTKK